MKTETIYISRENINAFREALQSASDITYLTNDTVLVIDDGTVLINDTRASYLIVVGMEYQKCLDLEEHRANTK